MKQFWDERYSQAAYAYGETPNAFFEAQLPLLPVGSLLLPAEGEGRNAVFAASLGWEVHAFDQSEAGQAKALQLAEKQGLSIDYRVASFGDLHYKQRSFDAIALIYAHFPEALRAGFHRELVSYLKPNGIFILEGFSKAHLAYQAQYPKVGGPKDPSMLYDLAQIQHDFSDFEILQLEEVETQLSEGECHQGLASVIRFVGRKMPRI